MQRVGLFLLLLLLTVTACGTEAREPEAPIPTAAATARAADPTATNPTATATTEPAEISDPTATSLPATAVADQPVAPADEAPATAVATVAATVLPEATATLAVPPTPMPVAVEPPTYNSALILDASGSMLAALDGRTRLAVAQDAVGELSQALPAGMNASLWVYGHRVEQENQAESCQDIEEVLPLGPLDPDQFDSVAHSFEAKGYTPITESLRRAAATLPVGENQTNAIILVSDGEETCGGDPCALAAELAAGDARITVHAIGLAVDDVTRAQLTCVADASGGTYADADNAAALSEALAEAASAATNESFELVPGLGRPSVVRTSPDGRHVYVISTLNNALLAFERDGETGRLTFIGEERNFENGVTGMTSPLGMDISPDGVHLYVSGDQSWSVAVFSRDAAGGAVSYVETVDVLGDVSGLTGMRGLRVSPDGRTVYATGWHNGRSSDAIAVLARDAGSGRLTRVQVIQNGVDGVDALGEINDVIISPDSRHVYVSSVGSVLGVFQRDLESGALTQIQALRDRQDLDWGLLGGSGMTLSEDGQFLYLAAKRGGALTAFSRDAESGALTFAGQVREHAGPPVDDTVLYNIAGAHGVVLSPDDAHLYLVTGGNDFLVGFRRDAGSGELTFQQQFQDNTGGVDGLENGYGMAITPDGRHLYVTGFDDHALAIFARDTQSGGLAFVGFVRGSE